LSNGIANIWWPCYENKFLDVAPKSLWKPKDERYEFHIINLNSISHKFFWISESEEGKVERDEINLGFCLLCVLFVVFPCE
jgi:hypothetical protein